MDCLTVISILFDEYSYMEISCEKAVLERKRKEPEYYKFDIYESASQMGSVNLYHLSGGIANEVKRVHFTEKSTVREMPI